MDTEDTMKKADLKKRGRPVTREMPELIPDTPENIARAVLTSPPEPEGGWAYLKKKPHRKVKVKRSIAILAVVLGFGTVTADAQSSLTCRGRKTVGDRIQVECRESYTARKNRLKRERDDWWAKFFDERRERRNAHRARLREIRRNQ